MFYKVYDIQRKLTIILTGQISYKDFENCKLIPNMFLNKITKLLNIKTLFKFLSLILKTPESLCHLLSLLNRPVLVVSYACLLQQEWLCLWTPFFMRTASKTLVNIVLCLTLWKMCPGYMMM